MPSSLTSTLKTAIVRLTGALGIPPAPRSRLDTNGWASAAIYAVPWIPVALLELYLKHIYMTKNYLVIARFLGRHREEDLTTWEKLSFFRSDIAISLVLIPLVLTLLLKRLRPGLRLPLTLTISTVFALLFFANFHALENVGRYLSLWLLHDAVRWTLGHPEFLTYYIGLRSVLKLLAVFCLVAVLSWMVTMSQTASSSHAWLGRLQRAALPALVAAAVVLTGVAWIPRLPTLPHHTSAIATALVSFFDLDSRRSSFFRNSSLDELNAYYRTFARAPIPQSATSFNGKERGSDVIFFVFETGPYRCFAAGETLHQFPNIRSLKSRSFVATSHHSTYPYTTAALFSLFTSLYPPPEGLGHRLRNLPASPVTGMMNSLAEQGYLTATYSPYVPRFEEDEKMLAFLGAKRQFVAERAGILPGVLARVEHELASLPRDSAALSRSSHEITRKTFSHDRAALEILKADIEQFKERGQHFAVAFLPQIGHGPWIDLYNNGSDYQARGRTLMAIQDGWLGEILDVLRSTRGLQKTVIVVTSDHGIRAKREDPSFEGGILSDYSFHVPLVLYSPNALTQETTIPWVTSHVDVAPTVLALLGATAYRELEQGTTLWDSRVADRVTFFFAQGYLGADGYHSRGEYYMFGSLSEMVYKNRVLEFPVDTLIARDTATYGTVTDTLHTIRRLQWRMADLAIGPR